MATIGYYAFLGEAAAAEAAGTRLGEAASATPTASLLSEAGGAAALSALFAVFAGEAAAAAGTMASPPWERQSGPPIRPIKTLPTLGNI